MTKFFGYSIPFPPWFTYSVFLGLWIILSVFVSHLLDRFVRAAVEKTQTRLDDLLIENIHGPFLIFLILIGGWITLGGMGLPARLSRIPKMGLSLATAFILVLACVKLYHGILAEYANRYEPIKPSLGILNILGKGLIILIGLLITLDSLKISITPLLTTLGIGGLAVALAFKDTLSNFFAGLYILADRPIRVADYVKLEGGPEGYVDRVGWRSTRIRTLSNNIVVIPNSRVSESIITNYFMPEKRMSLMVNVSVSYRSDTRRVERILLEEATQAAPEIEGMLADPPPSVRFIPGFKDSSLDFTLSCQVREFVDQYYVQHELRHRIFERFQKEGIEMPFPERTVHLRQENP